MRRAMSVSLGILVAFTASTVFAGGALKIEFIGIPPENMRNVRIEVLESDGKKAKVVFRNDATKIPNEGISLPQGNYQVYLEDKETGLIVPLDADGKGHPVKEKGVVRVDAADIGRKVREIKDKNITERHDKSEHLKQHKGKKAVFAVVGESSAGDEPAAGQGVQEQDYAPGELLIKYQPDTTLADRYRFIQELKAENRSKLDVLDVYRVKVSEATDLQATIKRFADDPRLKYMEMNMVVDVPEPVGESR